MEQRRFAAFCAAVLCFWLFALAFGSAQGLGLRAVLAPDGACLLYTSDAADE